MFQLLIPVLTVQLSLGDRLINRPGQKHRPILAYCKYINIIFMLVTRNKKLQHGNSQICLTDTYKHCFFYVTVCVYV